MATLREGAFLLSSNMAVRVAEDPCSKRLVTVTTQETIDESHEMILTGQWTTQWSIATKLGVSQEHVQSIIFNELWDLSPPIPPRGERAIKIVEITKVSAFQESQTGEDHRQMAFIFWGAKEVLLVDHQENGPTTPNSWESNRGRTGRLYVTRWQEAFHQDEVPANKITVTRAAIQEFRFELVQHLNYSAALATWDNLLPKMTKLSSVVTISKWWQKFPKFNSYKEDMVHDHWPKCGNI